MPKKHKKTKKEKDFEEKFSQGGKIRLITEDDFKVMCELGEAISASVINLSETPIEFNIEFTDESIKNLLQDPNIELEFTSADKRYKIIYTTYRFPVYFYATYFVFP